MEKTKQKQDPYISAKGKKARHIIFIFLRLAFGVLHLGQQIHLSNFKKTKTWYSQKTLSYFLFIFLWKNSLNLPSVQMSFWRSLRAWLGLRFMAFFGGGFLQVV